MKLIYQTGIIIGCINFFLGEEEGELMHLPPLKDSLSTALVDLGIHYFSNFKLNQLKVQQAAII